MIFANVAWNGIHDRTPYYTALELIIVIVIKIARFANLRTFLSSLPCSLYTLFVRWRVSSHCPESISSVICPAVMPHPVYLHTEGL